MYFHNDVLIITLKYNLFLFESKYFQLSLKVNLIQICTLKVGSCPNNEKSVQYFFVLFYVAFK